ncbi:acid protease [Ascodesmis nigricans]|uniref:Probable aspartic-type endopeptidase OPSB n=1 Tax=Ascodesmis nigricans TaxID=341454 RepID=A0A4S2MWS5_9PEZI|nr:acid protease [Ascodesmis nigricans]
MLALGVVSVSANPAPVPDAALSSGPRAFKFEKVKKNINNIPVQPRLRYAKRSDTVLQRLENADFLYYANVSLGTPGQPLRLHLDTGSSDIWVESASSELCQQPSNPCAATGTFSRSKSSTYKKVADDFSISYVDGEYANGDYGSDVFHFADGTSVKGLQFGIGLESTSSEGIMGIGMAANEVQVQRLGKAPYKTLVELMVEQGIIKTKAYSLYLNDLEASTGEVLFGGIDTAKFEGQLATLPIDRRAGQLKPKEFIVTCTGVSLTNDENNSLSITDNDFAIPVLLDTGSTYTYVPGDIARILAAQVGAQVSAGTAVPIVPCDIRNYRGSINFDFSGKKIAIPLSQLAVDAFTNDGSPATFSDGSPLCYFGIMDSGDSTYVMGDTFLRAAYVVYDIENEQISLGQAKYGTGSNIVEIGTGKDIPKATVPANAETISPTETRGGISTDMTASSDATNKQSGGMGVISLFRSHQQVWALVLAATLIVIL